MHRTHLLLLCFAVVALAAATRHTTEPDCPRGTLPAYAHNDYTNRRPLHDALALGYRGVEADVFLIDGLLRLGHDRDAALHGAPLEVRYLSPLRSLVARCGRKLTIDGPPFLLNVELKEESRPAFDTLLALLTRYSDLFIPDSGQAAAVEVVLVGWSPLGVANNTGVPIGRQLQLRRASGRAPDALDPAVRLISLDYGKTMGRWWARGHRQRWLATLRATKAAFPALRIRVYDVPVNQRLYRELLGAGVDLIGTMEIVATAGLLASGAGPVKDRLTRE